MAKPSTVPLVWTLPGFSRHEGWSYTVPAMHCGHCEAAISAELNAVDGVEAVDVDLESKRVVVSGSELSDEALRAAIQEAGYEVTA